MAKGDHKAVRNVRPKSIRDWIMYWDLFIQSHYQRANGMPMQAAEGVSDNMQNISNTLDGESIQHLYVVSGVLPDLVLTPFSYPMAFYEYHINSSQFIDKLLRNYIHICRHYALCFKRWML